MSTQTLLFCILYFFSLHTESLYIEPLNLKLNPTSLLVYKNFLPLTRLKGPIETIKLIEKKKLTSCVFEHIAQSIDHFKSPCIKSCIEKIIQEKKLSPLFLCWETITCFKIQDEQSLLDFSRLVFIILNCVYHNLADSTKSLISIDPNECDLPALLDYIDLYDSHVLSEIVPQMQHILLYAQLPSNFHPKKKIDIVANHLRFYLLNRLEKAHRFIQTQRKKSIIFTESLKPNSKGGVVFNHIVTLTHPYSHTCMLALKKEQNVKPFLELYKKFQRFHFIDDIPTTKELIKLMMICNTQIFSSNLYSKGFSKNKAYLNSTILKVTEWLTTIESATLAQALDLLDESLMHLLNIEK